MVPSFYKDRRASSLHLAKVLGDKRFPFPKDHEVLMKWLKIAAPRDAVILDFWLI
jgi:adenine-specific DNA-methyltransferase